MSEQRDIALQKVAMAVVDVAIHDLGAQSRLITFSQADEWRRRGEEAEAHLAGPARAAADEGVAALETARAEKMAVDDELDDTRAALAKAKAESRELLERRKRGMHAYFVLHATSRLCGVPPAHL